SSPQRLLSPHTPPGVGRAGVLQHHRGELDTARDSELQEGRAQMRLDRALRDVHALGDLLVAGAGAQELRDLALARTETVEVAIPLPRGSILLPIHGEGGQLVEQLRDELPSDPDLPSQDDVQRLAEERRRDVAIAVSRGAGLEGGEALPVVGTTRQQHDPSPGLDLLDRHQGLDAAQAWEL